MIHEVTGDLLKSRADFIAHGVAPNDPFDRGLALALRERWPAMYKDFRHHCRQSHPKPGAIWFWGGPGVKMVNLMTQEPPPNDHAHPGRASITHVSHALKALRRMLEEEKAESLALPRLATGVGGLDWDEVKVEVERHLGDMKIPIFVYTTYEAGVAAKEPGL